MEKIRRTLTVFGKTLKWMTMVGIVLAVAVLLLFWIGSSTSDADSRTKVVLEHFTDEQLCIIYNEFSLNLPDDIKPKFFRYFRWRDGTTGLYLMFSGNDLEPFLAAYDHVEKLELSPDDQVAGYIQKHCEKGQDGRAIDICRKNNEIWLVKDYISTKAFEELPKSYEDGWQSGDYR